MSLSGTFGTMPFTDLLQWLSDARKSGALSVSLEFEERYLRIVEGAIAGMESDDPRGRDLGQVCLESGFLDEEGLRSAVDQAERTGRTLADVLRDRAHATPDKLEHALSTHLTRVVLGMFLWKEGRFHFSEQESPLLGGTFREEMSLRTPVQIRGLLMEGMRRVDEWQRIAEIFPSDYCQVHALGRDATLPILDELLARGEPVALGELWSRGGDRYRLYEDLYKAYQLGLLAVDAQVPVPAGDRLENPLDVLVRNGQVLLEEKQYDEAASLLKSVLNFDAGRLDARELLQRAREEQLAELYQTIPPYKVPLLTVARDQLARLHLNQRERHLASRVNGRWDVGALVVVTPIGELDTMRALKKLLHVGAIKLS